MKSLVSGPTRPNELPGLLAGAIKLRAGRNGILPYADNDSLLVVADWCEENDMPKEAAAIREALRVGLGDTTQADNSTDFIGLGELCPGFWFSVNAPALSGGISFTAFWAGCACTGDLFQTTRYSVDPSEFLEEVPHQTQRPPVAALERVRDLARWDCICHMLGYPPLRLIGQDRPGDESGRTRRASA